MKLRVFQDRKADAATEGASHWIKVILLIIAILVVILLIKFFLPNPSAVITEIKGRIFGGR